MPELNLKSTTRLQHRHPEPWDQILGSVPHVEQPLLPVNNGVQVVITPARRSIVAASSIEEEQFDPSGNIVEKLPESKPTSENSKSSKRSVLKSFQRQLSFRLSVGGLKEDGAIQNHNHQWSR